MNDAGLSRDDDYDEDLEGRAGSRSRSVMGGSRAGTPMGGGRRRESTMDGGREGTAGAGGPGLEEEEEEEDDEDEMGGGGAAGEAKEVKERLDEVKEAQMYVHSLSVCSLLALRKSEEREIELIRAVCRSLQASRRPHGQESASEVRLLEDLVLPSSSDEEGKP